jgi:DNA-binding response OmpR family regulator
MVYIIEDYMGLRNAIVRFLNTLDIDCQSFGSITEFIGYFRNGETLATPIYFNPSVDILILDYALPEMTAHALLKSIAHSYEKQPSIKAIIISGFSREQIETKTGADIGYHFLHKPFGLEDLRSALIELGVKVKTVQ